ncbi:MAG: hypothetical protein ACLVI9_08260 [Anaerostipes hadrus]
MIAVAVAAGIMVASSVYGICASVWKYCKKKYNKAEKYKTILHELSME